MDIRDKLEEAQQSHLELDTLQARLVSLELGRTIWEAETEGLLLKAGGILKSANNAESRARTMQKNYENFFDTVDPDSLEALQEEGGAAVPQADGDPGETEELLPLPLGLAPTGKALATHLKFAR